MSESRPLARKRKLGPQIGTIVTAGNHCLIIRRKSHFPCSRLSWSSEFRERVLAGGRAAGVGRGDFHGRAHGKPPVTNNSTPAQGRPETLLDYESVPWQRKNCVNVRPFGPPRFSRRTDRCVVHRNSGLDWKQLNSVFGFPRPAAPRP